MSKPTLTPQEALDKLLEPVDLAGDLATLERHIHERDAWLRACDLQHMDPDTSAKLALRQQALAEWIESLTQSLSAQWEGAKRFRHVAHSQTAAASQPPQRTSKRV